MRVTLAALLLGTVLGVAALNLALGGVWLVAVFVVVLLRRRLAAAAWLVLVLACAVGAIGTRVGWLGPPATRSYEVDEAGWLLERLGGVTRQGSPVPSAGDGLRARLRARRAEELRYSAGELERRAAAAVAFARSLGSVRARVPAEVAALEAATRRLALTLTAPEFRDLGSRQARLRAWLDDLETHVSHTGDRVAQEEVARALDPAVMAPLSLGAVREDLARAERAVQAVARALSGQEVRLAATSAIRYEEEEARLVVEDRYEFRVEPPLRVVRLELGGAGPGRAAGGQRVLSWQADGGPTGTLSGDGEIWPTGGASRLVVVDRTAGPVHPGAVRSVLKPISFARVVVTRAGPEPGEVLVSVTVEGTGSAPALLPVAAPIPPLVRVVAPPHSLHYVNRPGAVSLVDGHDVWEREGRAVDTPGEAEVVLELVPPAWLVRNAAFGALRRYLYAPNLAATTALAALASATVALAPRRRPAAPVTGA